MSKKPAIIKPKTVAIPTDHTAQRKLKTTLGIIIAVFAFLLYAQSISFNYTMDDHPVIDKNKLTTQGIASIPTLLKTDYWYGFKEEYRGPVYRPTSLIVFAIEWQFFPDNPNFYHLINVILFAISCWLLFVTLSAFFERKSGSFGIMFPFVCSLLYASHPIHTEVVNNIKSLDEILCFLFGIASTFFIIKSVSKESNRYLILGAACFLLSMLSKETGVTFLVTIPLTVFVFIDVSRSKVIKISVALITVSLLYFIVRAQVLQSINLNTSNSYLYNSLVAAPSFISRQATAFYILMRYILLLIFPVNLTCDYNFSQIKLQTLNDFPAIAVLLINLSLGVYAIIKIRKKSIVAFGILFFYIVVAPVSNIFILNGATMAERFMYTPSLGFCIVLTYFLFKLMKAESVKSKVQNLWQTISSNSLMFVFVVLIISLYSFKTISRSRNWKDNYSIFRHDAEVSENSATIHYLLGRAILNDIYPNEKNVEQKNKYVDTAIIEFAKAIQIYPKEPNYFYYLGVAYADKNDNENAVRNYEIAVRLFQDYHLPNSDLFVNLGKSYFKTNQYLKASDILDSALKYDPKSSDAYKDKGDVLFQLARYQEASVEFKKAIDLNPKFTFAYRNLGTTYANLKEYSKALESYNSALKLDSTDMEIYKFISMIYEITGDSIKAKEYFEKANKMSGGQGR